MEVRKGKWTEGKKKQRQKAGNLKEIKRERLMGKRNKEKNRLKE